jgi:hypothetical protein
MDEIEQAYGKNFNMARLDIDALRHETRKFAGAGGIEAAGLSWVRTKTSELSCNNTFGVYAVRCVEDFIKR